MGNYLRIFVEICVGRSSLKTFFDVGPFSPEEDKVEWANSFREELERFNKPNSSATEKNPIWCFKGAMEGISPQTPTVIPPKETINSETVARARTQALEHASSMLTFLRENSPLM